MLSQRQTSTAISFLAFEFPTCSFYSVCTAKSGLGLFLGTTWLDLGISTKISLWPESLADVWRLTGQCHVAIAEPQYCVGWWETGSPSGGQVCWMEERASKEFWSQHCQIVQNKQNNNLFIQCFLEVRIYIPKELYLHWNIARLIWV